MFSLCTEHYGLKLTSKVIRFLDRLIEISCSMRFIELRRLINPLYVLPKALMTKYVDRRIVWVCLVVKSFGGVQYK